MQWMNLCMNEFVHKFSVLGWLTESGNLRKVLKDESIKNKKETENKCILGRVTQPAMLHTVIKESYALEILGLTLV